MRKLSSHVSCQQETGQTLVWFVLMLAVLLGFVALSIDVGLAYMERRNLQNAVDSAALAAAQDLVAGESDATATATAIDYVERYGFSAPTDVVQVHIPPTTGPYAGQSGYVEVFAASEAPTAFLALFRSDPYTMHARSVSEGKPGSESSGSGSGDGGGGDGGLPPPATLPTVDCNAGSPTVDGRVTAGDGYTKIGDLVGGSTDYGDVFYACNGTDLFFAMRLNGPDTGGGVANENVYGGCKAGEVQIDGDQVKKLKGAVDSVGGSSFTVFADGQLWTVDVDGGTSYKGGLGGIGDLTPGQGVEVKGTLLGPTHALATEVRANNKTYCTPDTNPNYNADYNTGWDKHDFDALWKSDRARFQIACDDAVRHDFVQDYLRPDGSDWVSDAAGDGEVITAGPGGSASSLEWNLEHPNETGWGDDPGEDPLVQSPPFNPSYPYYDSEYDGWIWEMIYEFKVPQQPYDDCSGPIQFGLYNFAGETGPLQGIHSSPAKTADSAWLQINASVLRLVE